MKEIQSESKFIWKLLWHILLTPITFILVLLGKKELKDLFQPFYDVSEFIFEPKLTLTIIIITTITSFYAWNFMSIETMDNLVNYPKDILSINRWFVLISSGFIHVDIWHLLGNMLVLFIFGRVVERKFGSGKTMLIYFGAMLISSIGDSIIGLALGTSAGGLGASGAIMGLVAAAILINPFYITYELIVPLPIIVVGWITISADILGILSRNNDGIGHVAHLFGYLSIAIIIFLLDSDEREELKKGLIINIISLIVAAIIYVYLMG
jgi:membrane associated rhomboid family serine protease